MRILGFSFVFGLLIFCLLIVWHEGKIYKGSKDIKNNHPIEKLETYLVGEGWSHKAAKSVINVNQSRYLDFSLARKEVEFIAPLARYEECISLLEERPQVSGLLLLSSDPKATAECLIAADHKGNFLPIAASFTRKLTQNDVDEWTIAVKRHQSLISRFVRTGMMGVDEVFIYPTTNKVVADVYGRWLDSVFTNTSKGDDRFYSLVNFVIECGETIRRQMEDDEVFLRQFEKSVWPNFLSVVESDPSLDFVSYGDNTEVWDFLSHFNSFGSDIANELLKRNGLLSVKLFKGDNALPENLHNKIVKFLLSEYANDWNTLDQFDRFSREPNFRKLLAQPHFENQQISALIVKLQTKGANYPVTLENWIQLKPKSLLEEIGPPPKHLGTHIPGYGSYYTIKKLIQGREITVEDWVNVSGDVIEVVFVFTPIKGGGKGATIYFRQKFRKDAVKHITKKTREEMVGNSDTAAPWLMRAALKKIPEETAEKWLSKGVIDVTKITRKGFDFSKKVGGDRASFKKITDLEAKIFMRSDCRVYVNITPKVAEEINSLAFDCFLKNPLKEGVEKLLTEDDYERNVSAWWIHHANDSGSNK